MAYTIEKDWITTEGLRAVVAGIVQLSNGNIELLHHYCGYVGVERGHPLFGVAYNEDIPVSLQHYWEEVLAGPIGDRDIIDVLSTSLGSAHVGTLFNVHGGITFSTSQKYYPSKYPIISDLWWFGFDCNHYGDAPHPDFVDSYPFSKGKFRDIPYVVEHCERLALQLSNINHSISIFNKQKVQEEDNDTTRLPE
jgi:hypothetical protein